MNTENTIKKILDKNNIGCGTISGTNVKFTYISNTRIKINKFSYPSNFIGYIEVIPLLRGNNFGFTFYKRDLKSWKTRVSLDNYQIQAISKVCKKLNKELSSFSENEYL